MAGTDVFSSKSGVTNVVVGADSHAMCCDQCSKQCAQGAQIRHIDVPYKVVKKNAVIVGKTDH